MGSGKSKSENTTTDYSTTNTQQNHMRNQFVEQQPNSNNLFNFSWVSFGGGGILVLVIIGLGCVVAIYWRKSRKAERRARKAELHDLLVSVGGRRGSTPKCSGGKSCSAEPPKPQQSGVYPSFIQQMPARQFEQQGPVVQSFSSGSGYPGINSGANFYAGNFAPVGFMPPIPTLSQQLALEQQKQQLSADWGRLREISYGTPEVQPTVHARPTARTVSYSVPRTPAAKQPESILRAPREGLSRSGSLRSVRSVAVGDEGDEQVELRVRLDEL